MPETPHPAPPAASSARAVRPAAAALAAGLVGALLGGPLGGCATTDGWADRTDPADDATEESALTQARIRPQRDVRSAERIDVDPLFPGNAAAGAPADRGNVVFADSQAGAGTTGRGAVAIPEGTGPNATDARFAGGRRDWLVNAYGELVNRPDPGPGPFDGAGNLLRITSATEGASFHPAVDRSGEVLVFASTQHRVTSDLYAKSVTGRTHRQLTSDPADDVMPAVSPDGTEVAFASNRFGTWDIFTMPLEGGRPVRITDGQDDAMHPSFSPDGRWLAYCRLASHSGRWELWLVDRTTLTHQFLDYGLFPEWNPDPARMRLAYQRARERGSRLFSVWTLDVVEGEATNRTEIVSAANAACMHPTWSPDGRRLSFVTVLDPDAWGEARPPRSDVWVIDWDGTSRTILTDSDSLNLDPTWSSTGAIYFMSDRSGTDNVWAVETGRTIMRPGTPRPASESADDLELDRMTTVPGQPGAIPEDGE